MAAKNLYEYYQSQGQALPSIAERAQVYGDPNYTGTADQTMDGVKTFSSIPVSSAGSPTTDNQIATKGYVDSK